MIERFLICLTICGLVTSETSSVQKCYPVDIESNYWDFTLSRFRNESGEWVNFSTSRERGDSTRDTAVHVTETLFECAGKKMVRLQGTLRDPFFGAKFDDKLKFHRRTGSNTALTNKGYTVVKLKLDLSGVVLTHRPLRTGELFEVRLDKRGTEKGYANGIGITTHTPEDGELPNHMNTLKNGTWLLYGSDLWSNNVVLIQKYAASSVYTLKAGDRMGVMKSDTGALHFFINGVDQGPAASNIPEEVYGVYELYGDATQATILHSSYS
ncbi:neuralized-like protein 4 [Hetaerina americana]|uniref:neuralized-like protein 4 n=1 Tax=Hetaerina americana TaxID=62018 RepID=UPI003A7F5782